ncbi:MAG: hypothetical protein ACRD2I_19295 [Vicinamibacterales bacterium]
MIRTLAFSALIVAACASLAAQSPATAPRQYDPATEVTYDGVVRGVIATRAPDGTVGVHLDLVTADKALVKVHLGPAMFIGMNDASFFAEDAVVVTGAFVSHDGEVALWARQVTKNGKTLTLRGADGTPRWPFATAEDPDGCGVPHELVRY